MDDIVAVLWATVGIIYLFIWPRNKLLAGISLIMTGLMMEIIIPGESANATLGWIVIGSGIMNITYEAYGTFRKKGEME